MAHHSSGFRKGVEILGASRGIFISSGSMAPVLKPGDKIFTEPARARKLTLGDIVLVDWNGTYRAHRFLYRKGGNKIVTKGDAEKRADAPVFADAVVGRVVAYERNGKRIEFNDIELRSRGFYYLTRTLVQYIVTRCKV